MKLPQARDGGLVEVRNRPLDFSFWPVKYGRGTWTTNTSLFVSDPWLVIGHVVKQIREDDRKAACLAFVEQAADFYRAASAAQTSAAKPLLLYYCFMNLAKALVLFRVPGQQMSVATHGLSEKMGNGGKELVDAYLEASPNGRVSVFDQLLFALGAPRTSPSSQYPVKALMLQVLPGHRLFLSAVGSERESFVQLESLHLHQQSNTPEVWIQAFMKTADFARCGLGIKKLESSAGLSGKIKFVAVPGGGYYMLQSPADTYTPGWITNSLDGLVSKVRPILWQSVGVGKSGRKYYVFASPDGESPYRLPQIASAYGVLFYLGSITRYRPHHFDAILSGSFGAFVENCLAEIPAQLLFLLASEFCKRDVTPSGLPH